MESSRASTSSGFTSEFGTFCGATISKQPIQSQQPTTSSIYSFARLATAPAAVTVGAYQAPLNLKSNTSNPMSSSSTSSSSSAVQPGFRKTSAGPLPFEPCQLLPFYLSPRTSSTSSFARSATAAVTVGAYQAPLNLKSNTSNPMSSSSTSSSSSAVQPGFRKTSASPLPFEPCQLLPFYLSSRTSSTSSFGCSVTAVVKDGVFKAPLNLKPNTANSMSSSSTSTSSSAVQPGFRKTSVGPLPFESIRPPPPKDPNARTGSYECIVTLDTPAKRMRIAFVKRLIQHRDQIKSSRSSTSSGLTSESGAFCGATVSKQPIQPPQPTTSSTSSFARSATAAATVGANQAPLNLKSNTSNPMSSSSTSSSSSAVQPGFRKTSAGPLPFEPCQLLPFYLSPRTSSTSSFARSATAAVTVGAYQASLNLKSYTSNPMSSSSTSSSSSAVQPGLRKTSAGPLPFEPCQLLPFYLSPRTSSTSSFARSATAAVTVGAYQASLDLKSNTSNPMSSSLTSSSSSAVQPGFRKISAGPLPFKSIRPPPPKYPNGRTAPYECKNTRDRPVNPVRQLPHDPSLKRTVDKSNCVQLTTPGAMTEKDRSDMLENSVVHRSKPTNVVLNEKAYPIEFKASGTQHFRMDFAFAGKESYMTVYTNRPDPIRYPENRVQIVHSVYKDQDRIYEKQSRFYLKGNSLACASVFCIERVPLEKARRVQEELDREADAAEANNTTAANSSLRNPNDPGT